MYICTQYERTQHRLSAQTTASRAYDECGRQQHKRLRGTDGCPGAFIAPPRVRRLVSAVSSRARIGRVKTVETLALALATRLRWPTPGQTVRTPCAFAVQKATHSRAAVVVVRIFHMAQSAADCGGFCRFGMSSYLTCARLQSYCVRTAQICTSPDSDGMLGFLAGRADRCDFDRCLTFSDVSFRQVCVFSAARGRGSDVERSRIEVASQLHSKQCHHPRVPVRVEMMHSSAHEHDRFWKPHRKRQVPAPASHVNKLPSRHDWLRA
jgi:hypothetical protein